MAKVSIPYSTIKSHDVFSYYSAGDVSIPYSTIKSADKKGLRQQKEGFNSL